ncbi:hypothetical protein HDU87_003547 [Geranomyces variabilis]|uniref:endo-polygalacturonase n=1 Tax=Geranomyces variabilis TaxID=109894 RepID=A0AAD5XR85_9FUNG|nr:hypothetical protein HDU87_003547 [Geranomyces variabilis]
MQQISPALPLLKCTSRLSRSLSPAGFQAGAEAAPICADSSAAPGNEAASLPTRIPGHHTTIINGKLTTLGGHCSATLTAAEESRVTPTRKPSHRTTIIDGKLTTLGHHKAATRKATPTAPGEPHVAPTRIPDHHTTVLNSKPTTLGHHKTATTTRKATPTAKPTKTKTKTTKQTPAPTLAPKPTRAPAPAPTPGNPSVPASCHLTSYSSAAVASAVSSCSTLILDGFTVTGGETLDLGKLKDGASVLFRNTITFAHANWQGPLVNVGGTDITVDGTGATLDGQGALYWDGQGGNGGVTKPNFFALHSATRAKISNVKLLNTPVQAFSINACQDCHLSNLEQDNSAGAKLGHNTDFLDIGASDGVLVENSRTQNQDDCVAVNSGSNIAFTGGSCNGGHGLSIGSVGKSGPLAKNTVKNVTFSDSTVLNSDNGLRIKTIAGGMGAVSDITYRNIKLQNIAKFGITIQQDYLNGGPTGKPTTGVPVSGLTMENVSGTVASGGTQVNILCGSSASCSGFKFANVALTGGSATKNCNLATASVCAYNN